MNPRHLSLLPLLLPAFAAAQTQIPVNPRATYVRIENDPSAVPAPAIPLSALGATAGQWLSISTVGAYADGGTSDTYRGLTCVFSSNPTLLPAGPAVVNRVPGAIAAGPSAVTSNTYNGNYTTDVPQDFWVGRDGWANGTIVRVPAGATHLFLSVHDGAYGFFGNNTDPNNDFQAVFTVVTPPSQHGTEEHCELRTGVNGTPSASPDVKPASPFATLNVEVAQRFGASTGQIWVLGANVYPTSGSAPVGPLPDVHMGLDFVLVQYGVMTALPGQWSFFVPPGFPGTTLILQGFFLDAGSRNGFLQSSDAHRIQLQ
jgi:hypothetical protein